MCRFLRERREVATRQSQQRCTETGRFRNADRRTVREDHHTYSQVVKWVVASALSDEGEQLYSARGSAKGSLLKFRLGQGQFSTRSSMG